MSERHDDDQPALFDNAAMRPTFGGRQLQPGFEIPATTEAMPLFAPAVEAARDRVASMEPAEAMRANGAPELTTDADYYPYPWCRRKNLCRGQGNCQGQWEFGVSCGD